MSRKKKPIKPTTYWAEQAEKLLKQTRPGGLVTPLGAPEPPTEELLEKLRTAPGHQYPEGTTEADRIAAADFVAQIKTLAIAGVQGYPISEEWYEAPEA